MRLLLALLLLAVPAFAEEEFIRKLAPTGWFDASADRLPGPAAHYTCDDNAASTTVVAAFGSNGTASANTDTMTVAGKLGTALEFVAASSESVTVPSLSAQTQWTMAHWIKLDAATTATCVAQKWGTPFIAMYWDAIQSKYRPYIWGGVSVSAPRAIITRNVWTHLAASCNVGNCNLYKDGAQVATGSISSYTTSTTGYFGGMTSYYCDAQMDDVRFYNRALSPQEVKELYNAGNGTVGSEAAQGKISTDSSGNVYGWASKVGNHDFYQLTEGYRPAFATFKNRRCIDFDGTDDGLVSDITTTDILDATDGTVFIVAETDSNVTSQYYLWDSWSGWYIQQNANSLLGHYSNDTSADEAFVGIGSNVPYVIEANYDGTNLGIAVNGQTIQTDASDYLSLGGLLRIANPGNADLNGRICEILTFDTLLDTAERRKIREYLRKKWGLKYHTIPEPVVHYRLDENAANTTIYDSISGINGATAATNTADMGVAGKVGGGMYINQTTNNLITIADNAVFDSPYEITAMAWIKLDNNSSGNEYFVGKYDSSVNKREWALRINSTQEFGIMLGHPVTGAYSGHQEMDTSIADVTIWNHVAATFDNGKVNLYVNGDLVPTSAFGLIPATLHQSNTAFTIGGISGSATHDGVIDDVIFYNKALSAADIKFIYNETAQGRAASTY
jgi:hypothetical protein